MVWLLVIFTLLQPSVSAAQKSINDVSERLRKFEEVYQKDKYEPTEDNEAQNKITTPKPETTTTQKQFKVKISQIKFEGNTVIDEKTLQELLADKLGELDFKTIKALPNLVSAFYLKKGYYVYAYIPKQTLQDETLIISIIESKIDEIIVSKNPEAAVDTEMAKKFLNQTEGEIVNLNDLKERLGILNSVPGVEAGVTVVPGSKHGTSHLQLKLADRKRFALDSSVNNYGYDATGVYSVVESFTANNPFKIGDSFKLNASASKGVKVASMTYGLPADYNGNRIYASFALIDIKLIGKLSYLKSHGEAETYEVAYASPFKISSTTGSLLFSLGHSDSKSRMLGATVNNKYANRASCNLSFELPDNHGSWNAAIKPTLGKLNLKKSRSDYEFDKSTAKRNGAYQKLNISLGRILDLSNMFSFNQYVNWQLASKNLDSFEQFSLGGLSAVRSQPDAPSGDQGVLYQAELACKCNDIITISTFFDAGYMRIKKSWSHKNVNSDGMQGYGLIFNAAIDGFYCNAVFAVPFRRENHENDEAQKKTRLKTWLNIGYKF